MGENYAYMDADEVMELQDIKVGGITVNGTTHVLAKK